jgi:hypothetical protein
LNAQAFNLLPVLHQLPFGTQRRPRYQQNLITVLSHQVSAIVESILLSPAHDHSRNNVSYSHGKI